MDQKPASQPESTENRGEKRLGIINSIRESKFYYPALIAIMFATALAARSRFLQFAENDY